MALSGQQTAGLDAVTAAQALIPLLRERAEETEQARRISERTIADLRAAGLLRMGQPARLGGGEVPLDEIVDAVATLARGCASTAWVGGIYNDHAITIGMFDPRAAEDIWGDNPDAVVAAGFTPGGSVERGDGGWRLSGTWGWSSGCDHADWFMVVAPLPGEAGAPPVPTFCLVERDDGRIDDNWHVMGMVGTGSKNIVIEDAFVPDHRTMAMHLTNEGADVPGWRELPPLYRIPRTAAVPFILAAPALGVAEAMLELHLERFGDYEARGSRIAGLATMQMHVAEAAAEIDCARLLMHRDCRAFMAVARAGRRISLAERARGRRDQAYLVALCRRAVDRLFTASGGGGIFLDNEAQRKFRDVHALAGHMALNWDIAGTTYGRVAFGLDPATPLI